MGWCLALLLFPLTLHRVWLIGVGPGVPHQHSTLDRGAAAESWHQMVLFLSMLHSQINIPVLPGQYFNQPTYEWSLTCLSPRQILFLYPSFSIPVPLPTFSGVLLNMLEFPWTNLRSIVVLVPTWSASAPLLPGKQETDLLNLRRNLPVHPPSDIHKLQRKKKLDNHFPKPPTLQTIVLWILLTFPTTIKWSELKIHPS